MSPKGQLTGVALLGLWIWAVLEPGTPAVWRAGAVLGAVLAYCVIRASGGR